MAETIGPGVFAVCESSAESLSGGPATDLWEALEAVVGAHSDGVAVRDADPARALGYRDLLAVVDDQAAALVAMGVTSGDVVALALRRSVREVVALLAVVRLGAAFLPLESDLPPAAAARMLDAAGSRVVLGDPRRLAALGDAARGRTLLPLLGSLPPGPGEGCRPSMTAGPPPPVHDSGAAALVAFRGTDEGAVVAVPVSRAGVVRLAHDLARRVPAGGRRFLRHSPLASGAAVAEVFVPLLCGGTVEVLPGGPLTPARTADFLRDRRITGLWLDSAVFSQIADYRPDALAPAAHVLTSGDTPSPGQLTRVLRRCPGIRISHVYGHAETGFLTTVRSIADPDDAADPLPAGRTAPGTGVAVLDTSCRIVPVGSEGEVYVYGSAVCAGYPNDAVATARHFRRFDSCRDDILFRTGDLGCQDAAGRLGVVACRPGEITVAGSRIQAASIALVLREHPEVEDAVVLATPAGGLLAGVVAARDPALPEALRVHVADRLPTAAVPALWALVERIPVDSDGRPDGKELARIATSANAVGRRAEARSTGDEPASADQDAARFPPADTAPSHAPSVESVEGVVHAAWQEVLAGRQVDRDDVFYDIGASSLHLLRLRARLRERLPGRDITVQDLYLYPTIALLAEHLASPAG